MTEPMTREQVARLLADAMMPMKPEDAHELYRAAPDIARALLATMTELEQVKRERDHAVEVADRDHARAEAAETALVAMTEREGVLENIPDYDAGLLNDWGGGNVDWWQDYLRAEIGRANDHWRAALQHKDATNG